jgi:hypothetical protein
MLHVVSVCSFVFKLCCRSTAGWLLPCIHPADGWLHDPAHTAHDFEVPVLPAILLLAGALAAAFAAFHSTVSELDCSWCFPAGILGLPSSLGSLGSPVHPSFLMAAGPMQQHQQQQQQQHQQQLGVMLGHTQARGVTYVYHLNNAQVRRAL